MIWNLWYVPVAGAALPGTRVRLWHAGVLGVRAQGHTVSPHRIW